MTRENLLDEIWHFNPAGTIPAIECVAVPTVGWIETPVLFFVVSRPKFTKLSVYVRKCS